MDEHELAWAAGFFDGDGWAALVRQKGRRTGQPQARINQSSLDGVPEVLLRFRDAVGIGRIGGPKIEDRREPLYWWVASSRGDVTRTGDLIGPWLSRQKRAQFVSAASLRFDRPPIDTFAWAAGLFDAEGSTSLSDHRSHEGYKYVEASITQGGGKRAAPDELVRFLDIVERGKVYGPYEQDGATEPIYRWRLQQADAVRRLLHLLQPWLCRVKRVQAWGALAVIDRQAVLPRGRPDWGSHKTHCVHGHEYASARMRPYVSRGRSTPVRENHRCLTCLRELARRKRAMKGADGDLPAADRDTPDDRATC
ncbi:MAG TPA: hypothetical protein VL333_04950 [Candidatus Saccharimonadales bacterium]|nr:hypothetical protein [Candidatus Saccharimonadales bacterium]